MQNVEHIVGTCAYSNRRTTLVRSCPRNLNKLADLGMRLSSLNRNSRCEIRVQPAGGALMYICTALQTHLHTRWIIDIPAQQSVGVKHSQHPVRFFCRRDILENIGLGVDPANGVSRINLHRVCPDRHGQTKRPPNHPPRFLDAPNILHMKLLNDEAYYVGSDICPMIIHLTSSHNVAMRALVLKYCRPPRT